MAIPPVNRSTLVAADTNVLLDLAVPRDKVHDAVEILRRRVPGVDFVVLPTVLDELHYIARDGDTVSDRSLATNALRSLVREWKFRPVDFAPVEHGIVAAVAAKLRGQDLIPEHEHNDSYILAEAALADCTMLLTSDEHLRGADPTLLSLLLKSSDVGAVVVRTPTEIVRQFGGKR